MTRLAGVLLSMAAAPSLLAGTFSFPDIDPIRAASAPMATVLIDPVPADAHTFEIVLSYVSVISGSWHTGTIHEELERNGLPIAPWELALLEERHPFDEMFRLDLEGWQANLRWSTALTPHLDVALEVPWVTYGQPHWDRLAETFHDLVGIGQNERPQFPRGVTLLYAYGSAGRVELRDEIAQSGWGDVRASVATSVGRWLGAEHRFVGLLEAPTGTTSPLHGSGGWDVGARWFARWTIGPVDVIGGAGATWLDSNGTWVGFERTDTRHLMLQVQLQLTTNLSLQGRLQRDSSPLADAFPASSLGDAAVRMDVGVRWSTRPDRWVGLAVVENLTGYGVAPDYSLHIGAGWSIRRARTR